jgi:hypothetical protein
MIFTLSTSRQAKAILDRHGHQRSSNGVRSQLRNRTPEPIVESSEVMLKLSAQPSLEDTRCCSQPTPSESPERQDNGRRIGSRSTHFT